jgi:transcriptional regulator with XRE-family HTH domain
MQKFRLVYGVSVRAAASEFGCSASHISRVERGDTKPSRALVQFYEQRFETDGLLSSLFEIAAHAGEQNRQRFGGHRPKRVHAIEGDATAFVGNTIPHGTLMQPGELFVKTWRIRNAGSVPWIDRQLERQGPLTGPGLITSPRYIEVPDAAPGEVAEIDAILKAPTYDCSSIAYFKMVDCGGLLCFPDVHQLGLDVLVRVEQ